MYCFYSRSLIKYILKLKYQFFNHKSLGWILLLITVISVAWNICSIVLWIENSYHCSCSYIMITGKRYHITNNDICSMIKKLDALGAFINQDINVIQRQIEYLPWIQQVSVRKKWPDTLKIHVVEHIPIALWNDLQIISVTGRIFSISKVSKNDNLLVPVLYGPENSNVLEVLANYYIFDEILKKSTKLRMQSLRIDMRKSWQIILENNMYIKLGRKNIIERLNYFIKIYPILLCKMSEKNQCIDYVDLRYTAGFAVKWVS